MVLIIDCDEKNKFNKPPDVNWGSKKLIRGQILSKDAQVETVCLDQLISNEIGKVRDHASTLVQINSPPN